MSWNDDEAAAKPTTAATAATDLPESGQVTAENFLSPQSARLHGSDFRSTTNSIDSKPDATWRDAQIRLGLDTARVLRKAVQQRFQARPKPSLKDWTGTGVRQRLQKKVAETENLLKQLHVRIEGTESSTRKVNQSLCILEREQQLLEDPAIICERRILVRGQRPEEELVEDDFQVALLNERFVLEQAHKMLSAYVDAGHELQEALQAAKGEMVDDIQFKRHALRLEKSALQFDPYHGRDRACMLPLVADGQKPCRATADGDASEQWKFGATFLSLEKDDWSDENSVENVQRSARHTCELIARTQDLEHNATKFVEDSVTLMQSAKAKVQSATEGTNHSMRVNMSRLLKQKKALEKGVAESQEDIGTTESLLQQMQEEIQCQKASLDDWEAAPEISLDRLDQRLPLAVQQDIRQSALERMQEQVHNAKSNVHVLSNKCEESKELLAQLRDTNAELQEHLNVKTACWRIDMQCAKLQRRRDRSGRSTSPLRSSRNSSFVAPTPSRLSKQTLESIRSKIKAAAYEGPQGQGFDLMFSRYDQDGSGCLSAREVRRALRRSLRIPESSISDQQIFSLCAWLDLDGSGAVDIDELVAFLQRAQPSKMGTECSERNVSKTSFELDCFVTPRLQSQNNQKKTGENRLPALNKRMLHTLRSKIRAASYAGQMGCEVKAMFSRFDHTGSGCLEEKQLRQVIRRAMRIPAAVISDEQISKLCTMLDKDNSGVIAIEALVDFVGQDAPQSGRKLHNTI